MIRALSELWLHLVQPRHLKPAAAGARIARAFAVEGEMNFNARQHQTPSERLDSVSGSFLDSFPWRR